MLQVFISYHLSQTKGNITQLEVTNTFSTDILTLFYIFQMLLFQQNNWSVLNLSVRKGLNMSLAVFCGL